MEEDVTFRVIVLDDPDYVGRTAISPQLAKRAAGDLPRDRCLAMERTDWKDHFGKPRVQRSVIIDAEEQPGEWTIGQPAEEEEDLLSA